LRADELYRALEASGAARAKSLAAWTVRVRQQWPQVRIESVEQGPSVTLLVGAGLQVRARVQLGSLSAQEVAAELYLGRLNPAGDIVDAASVPMKPAELDGQGNVLFEATTPCARSGLHGLIVRVRPHHTDLPVAFLPGLICWSNAGRAEA
jgi:starch phosphorylase